jgi:hypothetical protein
MDDLKINNIKKKFIDTKEKFTYLFGLMIDDNLRKYTEDREINLLFEIDSTLDMLNISISNAITNIEMFDNIGIMSNNVMDYSSDNIENTYNTFKTASKSFFSNTSFDIPKVNDNFNLDSINNTLESNKKDNEEDDETFKHMSSFVSSLGNNKSIPKVLLPMILYTYMKLDPESILNKEQKEYNEQIPVNEEHTYDIFNNKTNKDLNNEYADDYDSDSDNYDSNNYDSNTDAESIIGAGVEDLD